MSAEIDQLTERLETLGIELAGLVRDGGDDPRPAWAARDAAVAAGRLSHATDVLGALSYAQAVTTNCSAEDGIRNTSRWAQVHCGISTATASIQRRVGTSMDRYPMLAHAFLDGRLRSYHLAAVDRIIPSRWDFDQRVFAISVISDIQVEIIDVARQSTQAQFERFCAQIRDRIDTDGPQPPDGDDRTEIDLHQRPSGRWTLNGDLSDGDGAELATYLAERVAADQRAERDARDNSDDAEDRDPGGVVGGIRPDRAVRMGAALMALIRAGAGANKPGRVGLYLHLDLIDLAVMGADVTAHTEANDPLVFASRAGGRRCSRKAHRFGARPTSGSSHP